MTISDYELVGILRSLNLNPRRQGGQWQARCPAHEDRSPSLSACVTPTGRLLLYCHAGCAFQDILRALGISGSRDHNRPNAITASRPRPVPEADPTMLSEWHRLMRENLPNEVEAHERSLSIPAGGLCRLGAVWAVSLGVLACPMMSGIGGNEKLIGVRLRADNGDKWCIRGSHNGLFIPREFTGEGPLYLPEGFTDAAVLAGLGLDAIGRPSCMGGRELVRSAVRATGRPAVVISDRDDAGLKGAETLARELCADGAKVKILKPPPGIKDVRAWSPSKPEVEYVERHQSWL